MKTENFFQLLSTVTKSLSFNTLWKFGSQAFLMELRILGLSL